MLVKCFWQWNQILKWETKDWSNESCVDGYHHESSGKSLLLFLVCRSETDSAYSPENIANIPLDDCLASPAGQWHTLGMTNMEKAACDTRPFQLSVNRVGRFWNVKDRWNASKDWAIFFSSLILRNIGLKWDRRREERGEERRDCTHNSCRGCLFLSKRNLWLK